jgi:ketopantoate reductase
MAGKLTLSTLNDDTGVLATQNGMRGIAKAWANFNTTGGTITVRDSFNVSSVVYNGTGDFSINFTTSMPNANYCVAGSAGYNLGSQSGQAVQPAANFFATGSFRTQVTNDGAGQNPVFVGVAVFSS